MAFHRCGLNWRHAAGVSQALGDAGVVRAREYEVARVWVVRGWGILAYWTGAKGSCLARAELPRARNHTGCRQGGAKLA